MKISKNKIQMIFSKERLAPPYVKMYYESSRFHTAKNEIKAEQGAINRSEYI